MSVALRPVLYGTDWCPKTAGFRNYFQLLGLAYDYHEVEKESAAAETVKGYYNGKLKFPLLVIGDEKLLNPTIQALNISLNQHGLMGN